MYNSFLCILLIYTEKRLGVLYGAQNETYIED